MTADLTRYPIAITKDFIALWCTDCDDPTNPIGIPPIWTEESASEQVTEITLANLVAIAEAHETEHHADGPDTALGRLRAAAAQANIGAGLLAMQIVKRATDHMREYDEHGAHMVNVRQVLGLLSPTWPDGNYASGPSGDVE